MTENIYELLEKLSLKDSSAVYLKSPCSADCLEIFRREIIKHFGAKDVVWYEKLLQFSDGLQIDNAVFDSAEELIENNLEYRAVKDETRFIVFGKNGNTDSYVYDRKRKTNSFLIANFFGDFSREEEISEKFDSLEALLAFLVNEKA